MIKGMLTGGEKEGRTRSLDRGEISMGGVRTSVFLNQMLLGKQSQEDDAPSSFENMPSRAHVS